MTAHVEIWRPGGGVDLVPLTEARVTVGRAPDNDVCLAPDRRVSSLHAVLESFSDDWLVRDMDSTNGTLLRGERILTQRRLRDGDQLVLGETRLVFRTTAPAEPTQTGPGKPPELTPRERDVLRALCRPLATRSGFVEPASLQDIANELFVTQAAVKQHIGRLYDKFNIEERRRVELANRAIRSGVVSLSDLRPESG